MRTPWLSDPQPPSTRDKWPHRSPLKAGLIALCAAFVVAAPTLSVAAAAAAAPKPKAPVVSPVSLAPKSVGAVQAGTLPDLTVNWVNATRGNPATGALVQLLQISGGSTKFLTSIRCGTCTTSTFRGLSFGSTYQARVYSIGSAGLGGTATSPAITLHTSCAAGACVTMDALKAIGPANHAASGLLGGLYPTDHDEVDARALGTTIFRDTPGQLAGNTYDWTSYGVATAAGAQTIVDLDGLWKIDNDTDNNVPPTPWSNWFIYSLWVTSTVKSLLASGKPISYWEVYSEPGGGTGYYGAAGYATETPALLLQQFLVTYRAIKAVDPAAKIVGPGLEHWSDYPGQYGSEERTFDMVTFLNYAVANHMKLAAISWHEIDDNLGPAPEENTLLPAMLQDHVADARALIAARPALGNPQIFIDEYGMPEVQKIPGWDVAYLAALTNAGVNQAERACWDGDCADPDLDGLLYWNGDSELPAYYDRLIYASMSGNMVSTTSSSDTVTALASFNSSTNTLVGLIGRGVGCTQNVGLCPSGWADSTPASPTSVVLTITVPWTSGTAHLALTHISGGAPEFPPSPLANFSLLSSLLPGAVPKPVDSIANITPAGPGQGTFTMTFPSFADGDAYGLSITQ
jgi:hypothetical protein